MSTYRELYYEDDIKHTAELFEEVSEIIPGIEVNWFIDFYMHSKVRKMLDACHPHFITLHPSEMIHELNVIDQFIDQIETTERNDDYVPNELYWIGMLYAYTAYKQNTSMLKVYEQLPLSEMRRLYVIGHEMDLELVYRKIKHKIDKETLSIKEIRKATKLTQAEFSMLLDIPVKTIQKWERKGSTPPAYLPKLIDKVLRLEGYLEDAV